MLCIYLYSFLSAQNAVTGSALMRTIKLPEQPLSSCIIKTTGKAGSSAGDHLVN